MSPGTREKVIMIGEISPRYVAEGVERMSPSTRENILISAVISAKSAGDAPRRISRQALEKMRGFNVKIGYPDEWIDYGPLQVHLPYSELIHIFCSPPSLVGSHVPRMAGSKWRPRRQRRASSCVRARAADGLCIGADRQEALADAASTDQRLLPPQPQRNRLPSRHPPGEIFAEIYSPRYVRRQMKFADR